MRVIILAAGESFHLDGVNKILMIDPITRLKLIDLFLKIFGEYKISVVVGYKAIELIQEYPNLNYIYNPDWAVTGNAYSLGLALDDEPCFVISGDLIIERALIKTMLKADGNCVLTEFTENRRLTSLNCSLVGNVITEIYQGPLRDIRHPEAHGVFKIVDREAIRIWKRSCLKHTNLFAGQTLPLSKAKFYSIDKGKFRLDEVDTVMDYINLTRKVS